MSPCFQAFQFTDEHGEVCPANWKPGRRTFNTKRDEVIDYFKKAEADPEK